MDDGVVFVGKSNSLNGKNAPASDFSKMFTRLGTVAKTNSAPVATPNATAAKD
jgi:hypothetical protein